MKERISRAVSESKLYRKNRPLLFRLYIKARNGIRSTFALIEGTDPEGTITDIRSNVQLRGANVWILICGAGLASIGLDVNSVAVIIGAMLISPLMSPILGVGLGIGINDQELLNDSLKNFGLAVFVSLAVSTLYFLATPFGDPQPELVSRTEPTLLDVGVALFGGIAGIIAGSRREKTNAIPGVAIATALMPPLCTAGFGIATGRWTFFFGAFYLFFINAVFISLSTYIIVRFLRFPYHEFPDERTRVLVKRWIAVFVVIVAVPSTIIFYGVIDDLRTRDAIIAYLDDQLTTSSHEPIRWERSGTSEDSTEFLKVYMVGDPIPPDEIDSHAVRLGDYGLEGFRLKLIQMNIPEEERARLADEATMNVLNTIEISQQVRDTKQQQIDSLMATIQKMKSDTIPLSNIAAGIRTIMPEIASLSFAASYDIAGDTNSPVPLFIYDFAGDYGPARQSMVHERLENYLRIRTGFDSVVLRRFVGQGDN